MIMGKNSSQTLARFRPKNQPTINYLSSDIISKQNSSINSRLPHFSRRWESITFSIPALFLLNGFLLNPANGKFLIGLSILFGVNLGVFVFSFPFFQI